MADIKTNAGFEIIAEMEIPFEDSKDSTEGVVLGHKVKTYHEEWVTWHFTKYPDAERSYFWGHYIINRRDALVDYHERCLNLLKTSAYK